MEEYKNPINLENIIYRESLKNYSQFKKIFDSYKKEDLYYAINIAHKKLSVRDEKKQLTKLVNFYNEYFNKTKNKEFSYKNYVLEIKENILKIEKNIKLKRKNYYFFKKFQTIFLNIENEIKDLSINEKSKILLDILEESQQEINDISQEAKNILEKKILIKIASKVGIYDALKKEQVIAKPSGIILKSEIENLQNLINVKYVLYLKNRNIEGIQKAQLIKNFYILKNKIINIENLQTRYQYLSTIKSSLLKHCINQNFEENFFYEIESFFTIFNDNISIFYRKSKQQAEISQRKANLKLSYEEALNIVNHLKNQLRIHIKHHKKQSWTKLCLCICFLTGRRIYEICVNSNFTKINDEVLKINNIAKQKNIDDKLNKSIKFSIFDNADIILNAINILREIKDFSKFKNEYKKFDKSTGSSLRYALNPKLEKNESLIPQSLFKDKYIFVPKESRQFYAGLLKYKLSKKFKNESDNFYDHLLAKNLGHNYLTDIHTVQSYKSIVIY